MQNPMRIVALVLSACVIGIPAASAQATLELEDFVVMPMTGSVDGT